MSKPAFVLDAKTSLLTNPVCALAALVWKEEITMAAIKCKQEYTFTIETATDEEAMTVLENFHVEVDKILYRPDSRIKVDRSAPRFSL